jgi:ribonuclease HI
MDEKLLDNVLTCDKRALRLMGEFKKITFLGSKDLSFLTKEHLVEYIGKPLTSLSILDKKESIPYLQKIGLRILKEPTEVEDLKKRFKIEKKYIQEYYESSELFLLSPRVFIYLILCHKDEEGISGKIRAIIGIENKGWLPELILHRISNLPDEVSGAKLALLPKPNLVEHRVFCDASVSPSKGRTTLAAYCPELGQGVLQLLPHVIAIDAAEMAAIAMSFQEFPSASKIYSDNQRCVNHIKNASSIPEEPDDPLISVKAIIEQKIHVVWITREQNRVADKLAREAYKEAYTGRWEIDFDDLDMPLLKTLISPLKGGHVKRNDLPSQDLKKTLDFFQQLITEQEEKIQQIKIQLQKEEEKLDATRKKYDVLQTASSLVSQSKMLIA